MRLGGIDLSLMLMKCGLSTAALACPGFQTEAQLQGCLPGYRCGCLLGYSQTHPLNWPQREAGDLEAALVENKAQKA